MTDFKPPTRFAEVPPFDAVAAGADCANCPLQGQKPVGPQITAGKPSLVIVGEAPSGNEERYGRSFIGEPGKMLDKALALAGLDRTSCHMTNAILCRPKEKMEAEEWKAAKAACRPRLEKELFPFAALEGEDPNWVLALGGEALNQLTSKRGIFDWAGGPLETFIPGLKAIATFHPAFIIRPGGKQYSPVFVTHLRRVLALQDGSLLPWVWPELVVDPGPRMEEVLGELLRAARNGEALGTDVETDGIDPYESKLRCIGIATDKIGVSVPYPFPSPRIAELTLAILASSAPKVWQNGQFDRQVFKSHKIPLGGKNEDTMLMHAIVAPQVRHGLGIISGIETHAENWKAAYHGAGDEKGTGKFKTNDPAKLREMRCYNLCDAYIQRLLYDRLAMRLRVQTHRGEELYGLALCLDAIGEGMRAHGVRRHARNVARWRRVLGSELRLFQAKIAEAAKGFGLPDFNPNSTPQLHELYFGKFGLSPVRFTDKGAPSLNEEALQQYIAGDNPSAAAFSKALLAFREKQKLLSTYIEGLEAGRDGRIHFWWKPYMVTGRWASNPNAQNIPNEIFSSVYFDAKGKPRALGNLRDILCASEGSLIAAADYSQLEARIVALLSGAKLLLQWYAEGADVHQMNADLALKKKASKAERNLFKTALYAMLYQATTDTIWRRLVLSIPGITHRQVQFMVDGILNAHPEIAIWWKVKRAEAEKNRFVEDVISGRRWHFYGEIEPTIVANFPVQSYAGSIMNHAILGLHSDLNPAAGEHILANVHDEIITEGPDKERLMELLIKHMQQTHEYEGNTMTFTVEPKWGFTVADAK